MKPVYILGISAYYHDSAACLLRDGEIVAASQEERFTRVKGDSRFPHHAIGFCLEKDGIGVDDLDEIVFYENPLVKFERLLTTYHLSAPSSYRNYIRGFSSWITEKLWTEKVIARELGVKRRIRFTDHHLSHAASAFFPGPFDDAAILTMDGVGEWSTTTFGSGEGNRIDLTHQIRFPNSLGLLYSAFTYFTGFKINSGEYKLMGLAPYGRPRYAELIKEKLVHIGDDGSAVLNQRYFNYVKGLTMTNGHFNTLFDGPPRLPESPITQREMDLAASIQVVLEDSVLKMAHHVRERTGKKNLVMAGGVALNTVATGKLSSSSIFDRIWIQPASGDAGGALGAALWMWHQEMGRPRRANPRDSMQGAFLGSEISLNGREDEDMLRKLGAVWEDLSEENAERRVADMIADGKVVAVARGRAEFGPRALGNRSILGDARLPHMQKHMNLKIKFRESFRPFAPMVLEEDAGDYFESKQESPYMLLVYPVREERRKAVNDSGLWGIDLLNVERSEIPAVTHVDYSARIQTVDRERHSFIYGVMQRFKEKTGCSVIVNTSFNVRGEPIVNSAIDAYRCFMATEIDCLLLGNRFLAREEQKQAPMTEEERQVWLGRFELD